MNTDSQPPTLDELLGVLQDPEQIPTGVDLQNLPWPFCILYNGKPYMSQVFFAPDVNSAAVTANQFVQLLNLIAPKKGYPPLFSITGGSCPAS